MSAPSQEDIARAAQAETEAIYRRLHPIIPQYALSREDLEREARVAAEAEWRRLHQQQQQPARWDEHGGWFGETDGGERREER
ncbi:hypothetical protein N0V90_011168 [Kalmusia sp. IMI 367209]|nr:hypothetical protein N0V90_011168 [Kalmusia sp. IMI 367209]